MVDPTNHLQRVVYIKGNSSKKLKRKAKLHPMEFLSGISGACMASGGNSATGWMSSFGA